MSEETTATSINIDDFEGTYNELVDIMAEIAKLEESKTLLQDELKRIIGEGNTGLIAGKPVAKWRVYTTTRLDQTAIKNELPELAARYSKTSVTKSFVLIQDKGDV